MASTTESQKRIDWRCKNQMSRRAVAATVLLAAALAGCGAAPPAGKTAAHDQPASVRLGDHGQVEINGRPAVPLAVWSEPAYLFEYFRNLGLTCAIGGEVEKPQLFRYRSADLDQEAERTCLGLINPPSRDPLTPRVWGVLGENIEPGRLDLDSAARELADLHQRYPGRFVMRNINVYHFLDGRESDFYRQALRTTDAVICHVWPEVNPGERNLRNVAIVVDRVRELCQNRPGGQVSIWPDLDPHEWKHKNSDGGRRYSAPTRAELRFQIWLALIHGANGICFFPISFDPFIFATIPAQSEQEIASNSRLIERLTPALTAPPSTLPITVTGDLPGGLLDLATRQLDGRHYVFLLNGQAQEQTVTLKVPGLGRTWQLSDAINEKPLAADGVFTEKLDGLALRIWRLSPTASEPAR